MTRDGLKKIQGGIKHIINTILDIQPYTEVRCGSLEGDFNLNTMLGEIFKKVMEAMESATEIEKQMEEQKRPDLPKGTPVMCKVPRGDYWAYQFYKGNCITTDSEDSDSENAGWVVIVPFDKFKPTGRAWRPAPEDNYAPNEEQEEL